jgi:DNA-binding transcriptional LysR family regulator
MKAASKRRLSQIPLNSLMVFHEVAGRKSFSQAAKALSISQPAVTKHIKNLELKMGISLINRDQRDFTLTDAGRNLFKITKRVSPRLREAEELSSELRPEHAGELSIGVSEAYARCLFPDLLSDFEADYPSIKITLNLGTSAEIEKSLLTYKSDLGLVGIGKARPKFECVPLLKEDLVLITHPSHPLANNKAVSLKEATSYPFIIRDKGSIARKIVLDAFESLGVYPDTLMEAASAEFIKEWVARGKTVSIVARTTVIDEEKTGLIKASPLLGDLHIDVVFAYLKKRKSEPGIKIIKTFIDYTKNWVVQNKFGS